MNQWWEDRRFRMIQNNFRDMDGQIDVDTYVDTLKEFHANACMVGCGGITCFHETKLECQIVSPYYKPGNFKKLVERCHENGIRVIARFDFSKAHQQFTQTNPDWFSRSLENQFVIFSDTAATCVNGVYQQERSLDILREVLTGYEIDGVFFNMFGYQTRDYSGKYVGICQCDSCKARFYEYSGMTLPREEKDGDPAYEKYKEFKRFTTEDLLGKIYAHVKSLRPDVAVCTYSNHCVDMVRGESNSAVDRPLPFWAMNSEENVQRVQDSFPGVYSCNCVINATDIPYRFMGVSKYLNALRLYGDMAAGGNLDWCIIGDFADYPDRRNFDLTKKVFALHEKYEDLYSNLSSMAKILLIHPKDPGAQAEYLGLYKMLKESHILFDLCEEREEDRIAQMLENHPVLILPGIRTLSEVLKEAVRRNKTYVLATGVALVHDPDALKEFFGIRGLSEITPIRGSYFTLSGDSRFEEELQSTWIYLDGKAVVLSGEEDRKTLASLVERSMYGPPERCFGHKVSEKALITELPGKGIYFGFEPGKLYYRNGYAEFRELVAGLVKAAGGAGFDVAAPSSAEVLLNRAGEGKWLLQILNYSGFNGMTFDAPLPVTVKLHTLPFMACEVVDLETGDRIDAENSEIRVDGLYRAILFSERER